jgi:putative NADH-flavin reductase
MPAIGGSYPVTLRRVMARTLIVGCGCRGQDLARKLIAEGHLVRGTTRDEARLPSIEAAGAEAVIADPYRLATVTPLLAGVSVVVWPFGSASGPDESVVALNSERLHTLLTKLIDSGVRGLVYAGGGSAPAELLADGREMVRQAGSFFRMPVAVVEIDPGADYDGWLTAMVDGVESVLAAP